MVGFMPKILNIIGIVTQEAIVDTSASPAAVRLFSPTRRAKTTVLSPQGRAVYKTADSTISAPKNKLSTPPAKIGIPTSLSAETM